MSVKYDLIGKNYRARSSKVENDFFPTYHGLTRLLLDNIYLDKKGTILEPCAGAGDITKVLKEYGYKNVLEYDINPQRNGIIALDFLKCNKTINCDYVITNPPFCDALQFFKNAVIGCSDRIYFLLPLDYLHGVERFETIFKNGYRSFYLTTVFAFVRRPLFGAKYKPDGLIPTGATSFAWFEFRKMNKKPDTIVKWLNNNEIMGKPTHSDQLEF